MQYQNEDGLWVADRRMITWHYVRTWFLIDLLSVMPFDILGFVLSSDSVAQLRLLKIVRLARLIKLARILRAGRIFQRWEAVLQVNYASTCRTIRQRLMPSVYIATVTTPHGHVVL